MNRPGFALRLIGWHVTDPGETPCLRTIDSLGDLGGGHDFGRLFGCWTHTVIMSSTRIRPKCGTPGPLPGLARPVSSWTQVI